MNNTVLLVVIFSIAFLIGGCSSQRVQDGGRAQSKSLSLPTPPVKKPKRRRLSELGDQMPRDGGRDGFPGGFGLYNVKFDIYNKSNSPITLINSTLGIGESMRITGTDEVASVLDTLINKGCDGSGTDSFIDGQLYLKAEVESCQYL